MICEWRFMSLYGVCSRVKSESVTMEEPESYQSGDDSVEQDSLFTDEESVAASEVGESFTPDFHEAGQEAVGGEVESEVENGSVAPSSESYSSDQMETLTCPPTNLHWVRMSALRVHDNPALSHSMHDSNRRLRTVFIIDPWFFGKGGKIGLNRCRFLLECLHDLDKRLRSFNSRLYVVQGQPIAVLEELFHKWNVQELTFQQDSDPYSQAIDDAVSGVAASASIKVFKFASHTLYDPAAVVAANGNEAVICPKVFRELIPKLGPPSPPLHGPDIPMLACEDDSDLSQYRIPTMKDLGFESASLYTSVWVGGETEALNRIPQYCQLRCQNTENNVDMLFDKSALSPYIRFGCLSVRYFLWKAKWLATKNPAIQNVVKQLSQKLMDREFYFLMAKQVPNYDTIENNPICLRLPWEYDPEMFSRWKEGRTGYPWIDAAMRQLHKEGWIHHCLRESVASFLTCGDLWMSWVPGKDTFEELMLDYEPTVACGLWMRSSCSAFVQGPVPYYCPVTLGQKIDPKGQYIRTFCPELRNMPNEFIFSPWLAPLPVQQAANCVIGVDYPLPMVDHNTAGALCCERVRSILKVLHSVVPPPSASSLNLPTSS